MIIMTQFEQYLNSIHVQMFDAEPCHKADKGIGNYVIYAYVDRLPVPLAAFDSKINAETAAFAIYEMIRKGAGSVDVRDVVRAIEDPEGELEPFEQEGRRG